MQARGQKVEDQPSVEPEHLAQKGFSLLSSTGKFRVFGSREIRDLTESLLAKAVAKIEEESENYVLNVNEEEYISHVIDEFMLNPPTIDFDHLTVSSEERLIPAEQFPKFDFVTRAGIGYTKQVITYYLPVTGDKELLSLNNS